jgi:hypothetical protein
MSRSEKQQQRIVVWDNEASAKVGETGKGRTVQMHLYRTKEDMAKAFLSTLQHQYYALTSLAMQLQNLRLSSRIAINAGFKSLSPPGTLSGGGLTDDNPPALVSCLLVC